MSIGTVAFVPTIIYTSTDEMEINVSDRHYLYMSDTESDDESDGNYIQIHAWNMLRGMFLHKHPGSLTQPLDVPSKPWKYRTDSGVASLGSSQVFPTHTVRKQHSF